MTERTTEALIDELAAEAIAVSPSASLWRFVTGFTLGGLVALLGVYILGWREDLSIAALAINFWVKLAYTSALCAFGVHWLRQMGRPEAQQPRWQWLLVPISVLAIIAFFQIMRAAPGAMPYMLFGDSWRVCARNIVALALPIYLGVLWVMRKLAPTDLRVAGATTGLASGAAAASVYCLHCPETSMLFVLIWYSLGIAIATAIGALLGPRLLNW